MINSATSKLVHGISPKDDEDSRSGRMEKAKKLRMKIKIKHFSSGRNGSVFAFPVLCDSVDHK